MPIVSTSCLVKVWGNSQKNLLDSFLNTNYGHMTPNGLTTRTNVEQIVMQGEVFGPLECSVTVDTIGKECLARGRYLYFYKGVEVPPLPG